MLKKPKGLGESGSEGTWSLNNLSSMNNRANGVNRQGFLGSLYRSRFAES